MDEAPNISKPEPGATDVVDLRHNRHNAIDSNCIDYIHKSIVVLRKAGDALGARAHARSGGF